MQWINEGGTAGLITQYAYNADGVLNQVTDPGRNVTSYSDFTCGNLLPQITTLPADAGGKQLTSTSQWNCNTAAITSATNANGNAQTWTYGDPLIRPTLYVNQAGTTTTTAYTANTVEATTNFSGGSTTIESVGPKPAGTGTCSGPFPSFTCVAGPFGSWAGPGNVGSTTSAATVTTDQYDVSESIVSTSVQGSGTGDSGQSLTVNLSIAFPSGTLGVGSWVQVQGTKESRVNNSQYVYKVLSVSGVSFTAAVCATGESNCPTITNYSNGSDTGAVRFNNFFSWSLNATNFGFSVPSSSIISGIVITANVTTSCPSNKCQTGTANGQAAPYVSIGLVSNSAPIGAPKFVQVPSSGTTPVSLGNQNDLWGAGSKITPSIVTATNFGFAITVVQPDLGGGPDGRVNWSVNSATVTVTYQAAGATNSTTDIVQYLDGFGRIYLVQQRESTSSSNWDTVETDYNIFGQTIRETLPFVDAKGTKNSTVPGTTYVYDALGRVTSATDSEPAPGPGQVTNTYNGQDVLTTLLPAPTGENPKAKQYEYDGLERLKSVCELTQTGYGIWPGAPCGQANAAIGYLTSYTYDSSNRLTNMAMNSNGASDVSNITQTGVSNNVLTVTANNNFKAGAPIILAGTSEPFLNGQIVIVLPTGLSATQFEANFTTSPYNPKPDQGTATFPTQQTRSAVFDLLGRVTALNDAESGTSSFLYDKASSPCPAYSSFGDPVQKTDAVGNTICITYDALHRAVSVNTVAGSYAANTPGKFFVYDSASVVDPSGNAGLINATTLNGAGQVAAAFTCSGPCPTSGTNPGSSVISTEVFSYDFLQQPINLYQSPQHGNTFMITSESYFPNGQINSLGITTQGAGYSGTSTFFYTLDGMGRVSNLASFINSLSNTVGTVNTYQPATAQPTSINYFDGDTDSYTYDQNTLRMLTYNFTIPGASGGTWGSALTWNANGSLGQLSLSNTVPNTNISFPTCTYSYDDLLRLDAESCNNGYPQSTLSFDPFGNSSITTHSGQSYYNNLTFNPQNNQITSFIGCGGSENCTGPYHDANGNQTLPLYGSAFAWDAFGNWGATASYNYDAFDRPVQDGFLYGGTPMFYRPDGAFFLNTGNTWPNYLTCPPSLVQG